VGLKDKDDEKTLKKLLDWLAAIGGVAAFLVGILTLFLDEDNAKKIAWGIAIVLAITSSVILFIQRQREKKLKIAEAVEPLSPTATLRGLLPFEDGDQLPGRGRDVQDLYTLVASRTFRFGVLWGESGCGKTSLLRAGLIPKIRDGKFLPLYIQKPTKDPIEAIRSALLKEIPDTEKNSEKSLNQLLKLTTPKESRVVVLFDQFEEFFLTNRTTKSRASFAKWLGDTVKNENLPVAFLIGIRGDFFAQLQSFWPHIPEPTSIRTSYQLQNFDTEQAKQIFSAAAKADGIPFEPELIQAVICELETEEFVRPAELQVVGTRLKRKNIISLNKFEALGGARGVLSSYINEEIKQSANEQAAKLILRLMCAETIETKSPTDLSLEEILNGVRGTSTSDTHVRDSIKQEEVQKILTQFITARVLIRTDENKYNLAHDYLAPYVHSATEGTETSAERANKLLKRYMAEYREDPKVRIPIRHIRIINKYAAKELKGKSKAQEVLKRSKRVLYSFFAIPLLLIGSLYLFLASSYYIGFEKGYVVLRSGYPKLDYLPGFDQVVIQTDYTVSDLRPDGKEEIIAGYHTGLWFLRTKGGSLKWGKQLSTLLENEDGMVVLNLVDIIPKDALSLIELLSDSDSNIRSSAASVLGYIAQKNPEPITPEVIQPLIELLADEDSGVRSNASTTLGYITKNNPEAITPEVVQVLIELLADEDSNVRSSAASALGDIAQKKPEPITPEVIQPLIELLVDEDSGVRSNASTTLGYITKNNPEGISPEVIQSLIELLTYNEYSVRLSAIRALGNIAENSPKAITPQVVQKLLGLLADNDPNIRLNAALALGHVAKNDPEVSQALIRLLLLTDNDPNIRSRAASALSGIARNNPEAITTPKVVQALIELLADEDSDVVKNATWAFGYIAENNPELITPEVVQALIELLADDDSNVRSSATSTFGKIAENNPEFITPKVVQVLIELLADKDSNVRSGAAWAFSNIAENNPEPITPEVIDPLIGLFNDDEYNVRSGAIRAIGNIAGNNPKATVPEVVQALLGLLADNNTNNRYDAAYALGNIAENNPKAITPEVVQALLELLIHDEYSIQSTASQALGVITQNNPELITPEIVQELIKLFADNNSDVRNFAASMLGKIAENDPEVVQALIRLLTDNNPNIRTSAALALGYIARNSSEPINHEIEQALIGLLADDDSGVRSNATAALGSIARNNLEFITPEVVQTLIELLTDRDSDVGLHAAWVLGYIAKNNPEAFTTNDLKIIFEMLKDNLNGFGRDRAAYVLAAIASTNPDYKEIILPELERLSVSIHPHWRVSAGKAIELLSAFEGED